MAKLRNNQLFDVDLVIGHKYKFATCHMTRYATGRLKDISDCLVFVVGEGLGANTLGGLVSDIVHLEKISE